MGGEHYDSKTGDDVKKRKDPYAMFIYPGDEVKTKTIRTILKKEELQVDPDMFAFVDGLVTGRNTRPEPSTGANGGTCTFCGKEEGASELVIRTMNWEKEGQEFAFSFHRTCVPTPNSQVILSKIDALKMLGKNPTFSPSITCSSALVCRTFQRPQDPKSPYNCRHIATKYSVTKETPIKGKKLVEVEWEPTLYCKRGHPGEVVAQVESNTMRGLATAMNLLVQANLQKRRQTVNDLINPEGKSSLRKTVKEVVKTSVDDAKELDNHVIALHKLLKEEMVKVDTG